MTYRITEINAQQDSAICEIIKQVGVEHGAVGDGFGPSDAEVLCMSEHYQGKNGCLYLVATVNGVVVGGAGISAFNDSDQICELRKLFLLPQSRGLGIGRALAEKCLSYAKSKGYKDCYLDTLSTMRPAISLYEKLGFIHLSQPLDGTIHGGCDVWMIKSLLDIDLI